MTNPSSSDENHVPFTCFFVLDRRTPAHQTQAQTRTEPEPTAANLRRMASNWLAPPHKSTLVNLQRAGTRRNDLHGTFEQGEANLDSLRGLPAELATLNLRRHQRLYSSVVNYTEFRALVITQLPRHRNLSLQSSSIVLNLKSEGSTTNMHAGIRHFPQSFVLLPSASL